MTLLEAIQKYIIKSENKLKISSKDIKKNDIFIALNGSNSHGNKYIHEAVKAGAKYCITDKKLSKSFSNQNILFVENILKFLLDLSKTKRSLYKGNVIGICLLYTSPSPRDVEESRMPSSA